MIHVSRKLLRLAFAYPFLLHASLAVAFTYDRYVNSPGSRSSLEECYHWSQSTVLFNKRLGQQIEEQDKDPIWGTAAALAILTHSSPDSCKPEESWPLKSSGHSDLNWLRMSKGKESLWHIVNLLRPDSLFHVMAATYADMYSPLPERGINGISKALADICFLDASSTAYTYTYFYAAHAVSQILNLPDNEVRTGQTQLFTRCIYVPFEDMLPEKDPVAPLLLYLWYRKTSCSIWWIELRAKVECPAICSYLRLYHKNYLGIQAFLPGGALADDFD